MRYPPLVRLVCNSEESFGGQALALQLRDEFLESSALWVLLCGGSPSEYPFPFGLRHLPEPVGG